MSELGYRLFDSDNHYYETRDCFTRHLPNRYRDIGIRVEQDEDGHDARLLDRLVREAPEDAYEESFMQKLRAETSWALGF